MNSVVMWIGGVVAAILAALFAVPLFVDWNGYRGVFEEEASRILGRDVRVGGAVNLRLLPTPYLRFEKLRIADTSEGASEPLFRAETFTLWLSVPPLLKGDIEVRRIALNKPVVNLKLDRTGVGNWASLGIEKARLPFVPQNVALQSVEIAGGSVSLTHATGGVLARLEEIEGDVAAEALAGPYKLTANAVWNGSPRELRLATSTVEADGTMRFKGSARTRTAPGERAGLSAQLDGGIVDIAGAVRVDGQLTMQVPLPELPAATAATAAPAATPAAAADAPTSGDASSSAARPAPPLALDIKGRLGIDARQLTASELVASIENTGQPQLVNGAASLVWGEPPRLDFNASARWLDFDRLAPSGGRASPVETLASIARGIVAVLPERTAVRGGVGIEQITLGGEAVGGLELALARDAIGPLRIERFFAELPAGARLGADGTLADLNGRLDLAGRVTLAGPSLARFSRWAAAGNAAGAMAPEGAFSIDAGTTFSAGTLKLYDAKFRLAGHAMTGSASIPLAAPGALAVSLEADVIESGWLWNGGLDRGALLAWLDRLSRDDGGAGDAKGGSAAARRELSIDVKAGQLRGPTRSLDDVVASIALRDGVLRFDRLAARSGDALSFDVSGDMDAAASGAAQSSASAGARRARLEGSVSVANAASVTILLDMLQIAPGERTHRLAALTPLALAGSVAVGGRTASALDVRLDGLLGGGRISLATLLDSGTTDWQAAPAEITLAAENALTDELMALLAGRPLGGGPDARPLPPTARLRTNAALKAVGAPREGLVTDAVVSGPGVQLSYNGRTIVGAGQQPTLHGTHEVAADRLGDVMSITGLSQAGSGLDHAVTGTLGLASASDGRLRLTPSGLTIAGARIDGALEVTRAADGRARLEGEVTVDRATGGGLLAGLVAGAPRPMPAVPVDDSVAGASAGVSPWSDQPFAAQAFDRFDGGVGLKIARLALAPGLTLADARVALGFAPGRVTATLGEAKALGGTVEGNVTFDRAAAGVRASGKLSASGVALSEIAKSAGAARGAGTAAARVSFSGQALSPRALIGSLDGSGQMTLAGAEFGGLTPEAVQQVVAAAFAKQVAINDAALAGALAERLGNGRVALGQREIGIAVADGALKVERFDVVTQSGRVEGLVTIDLASFDAETEWRVTARSEEPGKPEWPRVGMFYTGALARLGAIEPRIVLGGFARELTVRRMEREVEELERLRKLDEERARAERERQRAAEAERLRLIEEERRRRIEQRQLEQQQKVPGAPNADAGGAPAPAPQPAPAQQPGVTSAPATAPGSPAQVEPKGWAPSAISKVPDAASGQEPPRSPAPEAQVPPASGALAPPRPRPAARPPRDPSASDTLLRSFGQTIN